MCEVFQAGTFYVKNGWFMSGDVDLRVECSPGLFGVYRTGLKIDVASRDYIANNITIMEEESWNGTSWAFSGTHSVFEWSNCTRIEPVTNIVIQPRWSVGHHVNRDHDFEADQMARYPHLTFL